MDKVGGMSSFLLLILKIIFCFNIPLCLIYTSFSELFSPHHLEQETQKALTCSLAYMTVCLLHLLSLCSQVTDTLSNFLELSSFFISFYQSYS